MSDCLFCKIIAKQIPSTPVYEDEFTYAFLDIKPVNPGHALVVPKKHYSSLLNADAATLERLIVSVQKVAAAIKRGLNVEGFNLEQNDGRVAGQLVDHVHLHVIPRRPDDGLRHWPGTPYASPEEAQAVAEKIKRGF